MAYIDLFERLPQEDKTIMENYISLYGVNIHDFIGLEDWLLSWNHANQRLYKLLGNQFIYKVPFSFDKRREDMEIEFENLLRMEPFKANYHDFYIDFVKSEANVNMFNTAERDFFNHLMDIQNFLDDEIAIGIKYRKPGMRKTLQIQPGMKPLRAIQKVMEYFKDDFDWSIQQFEQFRINHSMILNDKKVNGNMCFSIHPMDFMTMSDNNSNWTSCMSWTDNGCYHIGTVESMNANNVLCCYIETNSIYYFKKGKETKDFAWNNKKWRTLAYVTKDIIMSGKSYPYANDNFAKFVINTLKELAKKNLNWNYSFGPELYQDMKYVNSEYPLMRSRHYIQTGKTKKHNILFDTKGMYNDVLNNHDYNFWCFRNKVNHNKVISLSGKCPCLICGSDVIYDTGSDDYNERYDNAGNTLCESCMGNYCCGICGGTKPTENFYNLLDANSRKIKICGHCYGRFLRLCPCCGKVMSLDYDYRAPAYIENEEDMTETSRTIDPILNPDKGFRRIRWSSWTYDGYYSNKEDEDKKKVIFMCEDCFKKKYIQDVKLVKLKNMFKETVIAPVFTKYPGDEFLYKNLQLIDTRDADKIDRIRRYAGFSLCIEWIEELKKRSRYEKIF